MALVVVMVVVVSVGSIYSCQYYPIAHRLSAVFLLQGIEAGGRPGVWDCLCVEPVLC